MSTCLKIFDCYTFISSCKCQPAWRGRGRWWWSTCCQRDPSLKKKTSFAGDQKKSGNIGKLWKWKFLKYSEMKMSNFQTKHSLSQIAKFSRICSRNSPIVGPPAANQSPVSRQHIFRWFSRTLKCILRLHSHKSYLFFDVNSISLQPPDPVWGRQSRKWRLSPEFCQIRRRTKILLKSSNFHHILNVTFQKNI